MKGILSGAFLTFLSMLVQFAAGAPQPCVTTFNQPGRWELAHSDAGDELVTIFADWGATLTSGNFMAIATDPSNEWDFVKTYSNGYLTLANDPVAPWFSGIDPTNQFEFFLPQFVLRLRSARFQATNPASAYIEFQIEARSDYAIFFATYLGTPAITNVPETPETAAHQVTLGDLQTARLIIPPLLEISNAPPAQVTLLWPTNATNFRLEWATNSASSIWGAVTNPATVTANGQYAVSVPWSLSPRYFRLRFR